MTRNNPGTVKQVRGYILCYTPEGRMHGKDGCMDGQACLNRPRTSDGQRSANSVSCRHRAQQQNSLYPSMRKMIVNMTPHTRFGSSIMINIPIAVQNNAKPHTFFMASLPNEGGLTYLMHVRERIFRVIYLSSSSESRISITSFSVIRSSLPAVKRSITSGTISRILVIVS